MNGFNIKLLYNLTLLDFKKMYFNLLIIIIIVIKTMLK